MVRDCLHPQENKGYSCFHPAEWKLETPVLAQLVNRIIVFLKGEEISKGMNINVNKEKDNTVKETDAQGGLVTHPRSLTAGLEPSEPRPKALLCNSALECGSDPPGT